MRGRNRVFFDEHSNAVQYDANGSFCSGKNAGTERIPLTESVGTARLILTGQIIATVEVRSVGAAASCHPDSGTGSLFMIHVLGRVLATGHRGGQPRQSADAERTSQAVWGLQEIVVTGFSLFSVSLCCFLFGSLLVTKPLSDEPGNDGLPESHSNGVAFHLVSVATGGQSGFRHCRSLAMACFQCVFAAITARLSGGTPGIQRPGNQEAQKRVPFDDLK